MVDATVRLALALHSNRGAYAALLGSGISAAAGVPTGWQIVSDLVSKVAAAEGAVLGVDPISWYQERFGEAPDYSKLLDDLAKSPTERSLLLRKYFEPTDDERRRHVKVAGAAHRALAQLAAKGYISIFLTTNFDRLLEQALEAAGVIPITLSTPDAFEGAAPLIHGRCTVVKLSGDYLDTRIKNTPEELDSYHPSVDRFLDRVIGEYGLIVCGWSGTWDTALVRAFERCPSHPYTTFWTGRRPATGNAARLLELRRAEHVRIQDADSFFTGLASKLRALDGEGGDAGPRPAVVQLPARSTALVGRRAELDRIAGRLQDASVRLLTLVGPGGTGKTTLSIRAAAEVASGFPDGVFFVDLADAREADAALLAIARACGLDEVLEKTLHADLAKHLRDRQVLLLLDNFEQVTHAAGAITRLLGDCPRIKLLITSREALHVRAESVFAVPPLTLPPEVGEKEAAKDVEKCEAVQLFIDRVRAIRPDFRLIDANAPVVAEICRRLDGLPLAIELAAARLRLFSLEALRDQLQNRLALLRGGPRDLPERQQTLRSTVDWSYGLLEPNQKRLFALLAVFADADVAAVEAVTALSGAGEGDALDALADLIDRSLIRRIEQPTGAPRIDMLETIREFAAERLVEDPDFGASVRRAHATYYADLARRLSPDLAGDGRFSALAALATEIGNLRIAWRYWAAAADLGRLDELASGLLSLNDAEGWYLDTVGLTTDMLSVLEAHTPSPERVGQEIALRTTFARALLTTRGYTAEVAEAFARAIELFERGTEVRQRLSLLRGLAKLYELRGEVAKTQPLAQEILTIAESADDPTMIVDGHRLLGLAKMFTDDLHGGLDHFERAIATFAGGGPHAITSLGGNDPRVACYASAALTLWLMGRPQRAVERANDAIRLAAELTHPLTSAFAQFHSGLVHLWRREPAVARERAERLLWIANEYGFNLWTAAGTCLLGAARVGLGEADEGLADMREGMSLYQGMRSPPIFWTMLQAMHAAACQRAGRPSDGLASVDAAIEVFGYGTGMTLLPDVQIVKGDLLLGLADGDESGIRDALRLYRLAFDRARAAHARILELRAATRLLRLRRDEAAAGALRSVFAAFTEGLETADLVEARDALAMHGG